MVGERQMERRQTQGRRLPENKRPRNRISATAQRLTNSFSLREKDHLSRTSAFKGGWSEEHTKYRPTRSGRRVTLPWYVPTA